MLNMSHNGQPFNINFFFKSMMVPLPKLFQGLGFIGKLAMG